MEAIFDGTAMELTATNESMRLVCDAFGEWSNHLTHCDDEGCRTCPVLLHRVRTAWAVYSAAGLREKGQGAKMNDTLSELWGAVKLAHEEGVEATLHAIAAYLRLDASLQTHELVKSCAESAAEHCEMAALDYYVSTK